MNDDAYIYITVKKPQSEPPAPVPSPTPATAQVSASASSAQPPAVVVPVASHSEPTSAPSSEKPLVSQAPPQAETPQPQPSQSAPQPPQSAPQPQSAPDAHAKVDSPDPSQPKTAPPLKTTAESPTTSSLPLSSVVKEGEPIDLLSMENQVAFMAQNPQQAVASGAIPLLRAYLRELTEQSAISATPESHDAYASTIEMINDALNNKLARISKN